jgi:hypothetical protein
MEGDFSPSLSGNRNQKLNPTELVAKQPNIVIEQVDQTLDELIAHVFALKQTVADLRKKMAEVSTPALGNGILNDQQVAALLNKREKTLSKRFK